MGFKRIGFGQVEPNHLSAQRTSQIYAQLPAKADIKILENGQFVKYDYAAGVCDFTGAGEWMMVFNEVKLYDDFWKESYKDYAMQAKNFTPGSEDITHYGLNDPNAATAGIKGQMVPRVIKTNVGDIYTTNCIGIANTDGNSTVTYAQDLVKGDKLVVDTTGYLVKKNDATTGMIWQVAKVYTLADGQAAVKLQRIQ